MGLGEADGTAEALVDGDAVGLSVPNGIGVGEGDGLGVGEGLAVGAGVTPEASGLGVGAGVVAGRRSIGSVRISRKPPLASRTWASGCPSATSAAWTWAALGELA